MRETSRVLDENGIAYAGVGENLAQAGAARFLETTRGRVALLSFASSLWPQARAGEPTGETSGRPGLSPLRLREKRCGAARYARELETYTRCYARLRSWSGGPKSLMFAGLTYKAAENVGHSFEPNPHDVADILRNVRHGRQFSDFLIVSNHGHDPRNWSQEPPDYAQSLAHGLIDAGADAYVVHGPHQL
ncbi:CapA family protein [Bradyrhizobium elkanii]